MSRSEFVVRSEYIGTGLLSAYTFDFKITALSQLLILVTNASFVKTFEVRGDDVTYLTSVTFSNRDGGGTVNLTTALPSGHHLTILLADDAPEQPYEFRDKGDFTLRRFEDALDVLGGAIQRLSYLASRSLKISDSLIDAEPFDPTVPIFTTDDLDIDNSDKILAIGDDNASIKLGPTTASIFTAEANATQAAIDAAAQAEGAAADAAAAATAAASSATDAATAETAAEAAADAADLSAASAAAAAASAASADATPTLTGTRAAPSVITAAGGVAFTGTSYNNIWFITDDGADVDISKNPQIAAGIVGQRLTLIYRGTNTLKLDDGTGLDLNGPMVMTQGSMIDLLFDGTNWSEETRSAR